MVKSGSSKTTAKELNWATLFRNNNLKDIPDTVKKNFKTEGVADWIGPQPGDTKPILYVSSIAGSGDWSEKQFEELSGIDKRCFSYAYSGITSPLYHYKHYRYLKWFQKRNMRIFLDSGAHSLHRMVRSGKTLAARIKVDKEDRKKFVEYISEEFILRYADYVKWCYGQGYKFDFWVTLDSQRDCKLIYENTKRLEKLIGITPVSVYHGDSSLDWVRRYADDGHKLIGVGIDSKRIKGKEGRHRYYSELAELTTKLGMARHAFAVTGDKMFRYEWYSVDSTTHLKAASYGKILTLIPERQRIAQVHISRRYSEMTAYGTYDALSKQAQKSIINLIEANGFEFEDVRDNLNSRIIFNAKVLMEAVKMHSKKAPELKGWEALV